MWRYSAWQQVNPGDAERLLHLQRRSQMTEVDGVERTTEDTDHGVLYKNVALSANMTIAKHDKLQSRQAFEPDRAARMQFVGADADFSTEAIFKTVGET